MDDTGRREAELRAALRRVIVLDVSPGDFLPSEDPDWQTLDDAITELVRNRALLDAALAYGAAQRRVREQRDRLEATGWGGYATDGGAHLDAIAAAYAALDALHAAYAAYAAHAGDGGAEQGGSDGGADRRGT